MVQAKLVGTKCEKCLYILLPPEKIKPLGSKSTFMHIR